MEEKQEQKLEEVVFNGKKITKAELQEQIEKAKSEKGISIQEVSKGIYKTRIQD